MEAVTVTTPQADIDWALGVEKAVTTEQKELYLECLNGVGMAERVKAGDELAIRSGCILTGVFVRCAGLV